MCDTVLRTFFSFWNVKIVKSDGIATCTSKNGKFVVILLFSIFHKPKTKK